MMTPMDQATPTPVLEFRDVTVPSDLPRQGLARRVNLRLGPGEVALVRLENGHDSPLPAAAQGLTQLTSGAVRFEGIDWSELDPLSQIARRGRIGRVFGGWGWVSNLNVLENVMLREMHHTSRREHDIEVEADRLARIFGLERIPRGRPAFVNVADLRRAEWVRALLGSPRLILLERPLRGVPIAHLPQLLDALEAARGDGAAVLWLTADERELQHPRLDGAQRYVMRGANFEAEGGQP